METNQVETEVADSEPERRGGPWKLILVVVLITLIGVWLVPGDPEPGETAGDFEETLDLLDHLPLDHVEDLLREPRVFTVLDILEVDLAGAEEIFDPYPERLGKRQQHPR